MSTPFGVPSGAGATGPKRGTAGRGHATRGGLNPFARPGGSTRGGRGGATGTRGGRGRGDSTLPAARGSIGARRGITPQCPSWKDRGYIYGAALTSSEHRWCDRCYKGQPTRTTRISGWPASGYSGAPHESVARRS